MGVAQEEADRLKCTLSPFLTAVGHALRAPLPASALVPEMVGRLTSCVNKCTSPNVLESP
ncbi:hypothetical protein WCLP8_1360007 [uncultured Gammaproteobacteria bacterium]